MSDHALDALREACDSYFEDDRDFTSVEQIPLGRIADKDMLERKFGISTIGDEDSLVKECDRLHTHCVFDRNLATPYRHQVLREHMVERSAADKSVVKFRMLHGIALYYDKHNFLSEKQHAYVETNWVGGNSDFKAICVDKSMDLIGNLQRIIEQLHKLINKGEQA